MRLFVSVRPPVPVLDHLRDALALVAAGPDLPVRWTAEENWHLTVAFFGEVPEGALPALGAGLAGLAAQTQPFGLRLRGAGIFAGRTVWVGAAGAVERMAALAAAARDLGERLGGHRDTRERLRPHLTVGRVDARRGRDGDSRRGQDADRRGARGRGPTADALVHALALYEGPTWTVDRVLLEQSWPGQGRGGGPRYAVLESHPLG